MTIDLRSNNTGEGTVSPASLTFRPGNWMPAETVTITGVNDPDDDGDVTYTIVTDPASSADTSYDGFDAANVSVINVDNDEPLVLSLSLPAAINEDESTLGTVTRNGTEGDLVIDLASDDTGEATVPATVTIQNHQSSATFTLTGVQDYEYNDGDEGEETVTITALAGGTSGTEQLLVLDFGVYDFDDLAHGTQLAYASWEAAGMRVDFASTVISPIP